jgi:UDP-N-acetylmuramate: L-alanyl-gamma-D-glutamyl-meso-diaminopimelate ligase
MVLKTEVKAVPESKIYTHILGVCGTFMAGVATLAKALGREVSGIDANIYPPMSTYLKSLNIDLSEGYQVSNFKISKNAEAEAEAEIVIGNVISRGNPVLEEILAKNMSYLSGPEWLAKNILKNKWRIVVAGTHGKTTTASMIAWILEKAGLNPGFLIGGIPENFGVSARLTSSEFFVVEGDEYDTAFSDKRSKFVHYSPKTLVLNNLEYDHADIFPNVEAIERQFHHVVRLVPQNGLVIANFSYPSLKKVINMGSWSPLQSMISARDEKEKADWSVNLLSPDASKFYVIFKEKILGTVNWSLLGEHNAHNALSAIAAAWHVGVDPVISIQALESFEGVKRRLQCRGEVNGVRVYDDFAHHPTAIAVTLHGVKASKNTANPAGRVIAVLEPRSNTMRLGEHRENLVKAIQDADYVVIYEPPNLSWNMQEVFKNALMPVKIFQTIDQIINHLSEIKIMGDRIVIMSNGGFENIHEKLLEKLSLQT